MRRYVKKTCICVLGVILSAISPTAICAQSEDAVVADQSVLDNYPWKGVLQDETTSGIATLSDLNLNGKGRMIVVKPGERIEGRVKCSLNKEQASNLSFYRIVIGIKGQGAQTTIYDRFGATDKPQKEKFVLIAPDESGLYEVRFRLVEKLTSSGAMEAWVDQQGQEPDAKTTIGLIIVKK